MFSWNSQAQKAVLRLAKDGEGGNFLVDLLEKPRLG